MSKRKYSSLELLPAERELTPHGRAVCFYHADCQDGFFAAVFIRQAMKRLEHSVTCIPVSYSERSTFVNDYKERLYGKTVFIVDFSISVDDFRSLVDVAEAVVQMDHHVGVLREWGFSPEAQQETVIRLSHPNLDYPLPNECTMLPYIPEQRADVPITCLPRTGQFFYNASDSGAGMAMAYHHYVLNRTGAITLPDEMPGRKLVNYLRDRDLWLKAYPESDLLNAYIADQPWFILRNYDEAWEFALKLERDPDFFAEVLEAAKPCDAFREAECLRAIRSTIHHTDLPDHDFTVPTVVCAKHLTSRVGEILYESGWPFAMMVNVREPGKLVELSFRSSKESSVNVDELAARLFAIGFVYDGCTAVSAGGHRNAAGVSMKKLS